MTRTIGPRINVESLKKEAKQWLKALHAGDAEALARFKAALPEHATNITLRVAQRAVAREHGLAGLASVDRRDQCPRSRRRDAAARDLQRRSRRRRTALRGSSRGREARFVLRRRSGQPRRSRAPSLGGSRRRLARRRAARTGRRSCTSPTCAFPEAHRSRSDIARALLDHGADPNARWTNGSGRTRSLRFAASSGSARASAAPRARRRAR